MSAGFEWRRKGRGRRASRRVTAAMVASAALVAALWAGSSASSAAGPIYVDAAAVGAADGSSWADAFTDLQAALAVATDGDEVLVAEGTYTPHADDRSVSFALAGVTVRGGYAIGGAAGPDPAAYPTILSGDLAGDDAGGANTEENSYHVVTIGDAVQRSTLEGLTITGGNANGSGNDRNAGGGILAVEVGGAEPRVYISSSVIEGNQAERGGGIFFEGAGDSVIIDTTIRSNQASHGGGIFLIDSVTVMIGRSEIVDNTASSLGGGIRLRGGFTRITHSELRDNTAIYGGGLDTFAAGYDLFESLVVGNQASVHGGGIRQVEDSRGQLINTTVADNLASVAAGVFSSGSGLDVWNSIVWGNDPGPGVVALRGGFAGQVDVEHSDVQGRFDTSNGNISVDPRFVGGGDYRLQPDSPALHAGSDHLTRFALDFLDLDRDGDALEPARDLDGGLRSQGIVDMGAYEMPFDTPVLVPGSVAAPEGDDGMAVFAVPVNLSRAVPYPVDVRWDARDFQATIPDDLYKQSGWLHFPPGDTVAFAEVSINGDRTIEPDEYAAISLSNPIGADIGGLYGIGLALIENDDVAETFHVDVSADGANDGTSWADAFTDLQDALAVAGGGDEVLVAEGTYTPHPSERHVSFELTTGQSLRGGFPSGGAAEPDPAAFPTVLSGDLAGNDAPVFEGLHDSSYWDNSHTVVLGENVSGVRIDGFVITGGQSTSSSTFTSRKGGGVTLEYAADVVIANTSFVGNRGWDGGAIAVSGTDDSPSALSLVDVALTDNHAESAGAIFNRDGALTVINSVIEHNSSTDVSAQGSAIWNWGRAASLSLVDSSVSHNTGHRTAISSAFADSLVILRSAVNHNVDGGVRVHDHNTLSIVDSEVSGNGDTGDNPSGGVTISDTPSAEIVGSTISHNTAYLDGGGIRAETTPLVVSNTSITRNTAGGDGGGIESDRRLEIDNSAITENTAGGRGGGLFVASPWFTDTPIVNTTVAGTRRTLRAGSTPPFSPGSSPATASSGATLPALRGSSMRVPALRS